MEEEGAGRRRLGEGGGLLQEGTRQGAGEEEQAGGSQLGQAAGSYQEEGERLDDHSQ